MVIIQIGPNYFLLLNSKIIRVMECTVDISKTRRGECITCGEKIENGSLRLKPTKPDNRASNGYYHPNCFTKTIKAKLGEHNIAAFDKLTEAEQDELLKLVNASSRGKKNLKKQQQEEDVDKSDDGDEDYGGRASSTSSKKKKKTPKRKRDESPPPKNNKKSKKKDEEEEDEEEEEEEDEKKNEKKPKTRQNSPKRSPKKSPKKRVKSQQQIEIEAVAEQLEVETINSLKEMLRHNNQPVTGVKNELIKRVSHGKVKGALPKCPKCFGGNLAEKTPGKFKCKGFMDDDVFQNCSFKVTESDLVRIPWKTVATTS